MSRTPVSLNARTRLREAQAAEAQALACVEVADRSLERRQQQLQAGIARLEREVSEASSGVALARAALVATSGIDRAAALLGLNPRELKRSLPKSAPGSEREVQVHN